MPLHRLVHLIESHSQELASELLNRVHQSPHLTSFSKVPDHELRQRVHEIYSHLGQRSEEHTSELQSPCNLVCRLLLEKKNHTYYLYLHFPHQTSCHCHHSRARRSSLT